MRRKREQQKLAAAAKAEAEKKDMPGGDKILNILSSTENQGLINNLLGIGKTLGLTTKQDHTTAATVPIATMQQQTMVPPQVAMAPMMQPDMSQAWAQWNQYNPAMSTSMPPMGQPMPTQMPQYNMQHIPMTGPPPHQIPPPNFSQPPPGFPPANFSHPPPGYSQPPPPLNTNPPPPPVSQPPININIQQLSKCPPPNLLGTGFVNNQQNQQRGPVKDNNQFRQGPNEDSQGSNFSNRANWNSRVNRNNFNQGNNQGNRINYNQGSTNEFNKGNDDNDNKFGGSNKGGNFGRSSQDNYNTDNNYESCNDDYNKFNFNNFGNKDNNRFINRQQNNNQQQSEDNMPPELKKLMAKRKAVTDVFKPSSANFNMDSSSNVSSLSESFKKVSGDKGFGKGVNFRDEKFGPKFRGASGFDSPDEFGGTTRGKFGQDVRGPNDFGNDGSNNFGNRGSNNNFGNRGPNDFGNTGSNNFGTRGTNNFGNLNEFGNRGSSNFVNKGLNNFENFGNRGPNNDFENKECSENQDQTELLNQVSPDSSNFNDQITMFGNNDNIDNSKDQSKKLSLSDKPLDFEDSNNQLLSGNKYDHNKGSLDSFSNISGQKEFSFVENKESNEFLQSKSNSGSKENNQVPPNFDLLPPTLKSEADFSTDNTEFQCPDQSLNVNEQKLDSTENKQQLDTTAIEQQLDSTNEKNVPSVENDASLADAIETKDSDIQAGSDVIESTEPINPMIDESAWIPCDNEPKPISETVAVQIPTEGDGISNQNEQLNEISTNQDVKENDFSTDIQQQKSDTLPFMGAEDPKAEDMNLQPPPEQPNVAMITTLEEPPTPSFTDEISEEGNFENKNSDKKFQHPPPRGDFNNGNLNDGPFNTPPVCPPGSFGRQEPSFKSGQFNTAPPPFGQRENFNQPPPGPSSSKSTIPSLLTLKIDPPLMMLMPSRSGPSDDDQFDSDDKFQHKPFDTDVPQSNLDSNFGSGQFGFNKPPPFNTDESVDNDRNFSPGSFPPNKSLFNKDGPTDKDRNFSPNSFGSNKFAFGKDGLVGIDRNFASGTFGSSKSQFGKDGPVDKDRNFSSSPFGAKKSPYGEDGPLDNERNFGPSGPNKFPFVQEGSIGKDRNFGPGSFGFNKSTCGQDAIMERDRNFRSGLYGPNKPLIGKDGLLNKGRNFGPLGPFGANRLLGKDGPLNIDTNFGSGLNNISPSNELLIDDGNNTGPGLLGVVPNLLGSNPRLNELSSIDTNFCAESNHQCDEFSSMFAKNNLNEDFGNHNDPSNNSGQSDLETEKNFSIDSDINPFSKNLKGIGFSDGSVDIDNRNFGHGQFGNTLQQFSAGSIRNRVQSFDFQSSFNSSRLDDASLISPNQTVDPFEKSGGFGVLVRRGMNEDFRNLGPEFCVGKQFNYNHGEMPQDKSLDFLAPTKVIDYSHETRVGVFEFVEPVGIFDYGHGKLKPSIPDIIQDFQNWEDSEHNLHEYNEEMRKRSEKVGRMWTSPSRSIDKLMWDEPKSSLKDRKERNDSRDSEKDRDDRRRDKDRDERRDRDRDERLNDRLRDKDRIREKERDDRYADRNRDDRYRDSDRYGDRYRFSDRDRDRSRDKDRDDRYKDREDRYKERDDRYKDRDDRYKDRSYDKDRDERYKDRGYEKDRDDRYKDRVEKDLKDKSTEKDVKNKNSEKDMKDRSFEKELKDKGSEKDLKDRSLEKDLKDKNFEKDSMEDILEKNCEDNNSEKDKDLRAKRDKLPEQKEDEMVVEKSSSPGNLLNFFSNNVRIRIFIKYYITFSSIDI
jgi:hypothetical protein